GSAERRGVRQGAVVPSGQNGVVDAGETHRCRRGDGEHPRREAGRPRRRRRAVPRPARLEQRKGNLYRKRSDKIRPEELLPPPVKKTILYVKFVVRYSS